MIGSILSGVDKRHFECIYNKQKVNSERKEFLEGCLKALKEANDDSDLLLKHRITPELIRKRLIYVIDTANKVYLSNPQKNIIKLNHFFKITIFFYPNYNLERLTSQDKSTEKMPSLLHKKARCLLCGHIINKPKIYHIENLFRGISMNINEISMHMLDHDYLGRSKRYRLDPELLAQLLGYTLADK